MVTSSHDNLYYLIELGILPYLRKFELEVKKDACRGIFMIYGGPYIVIYEFQLLNSRN